MRYRKKPVVIEAYRFTAGGVPWGPIPEWLKEAQAAGKVESCPGGDIGLGYLLVHTLEGTMTANPGDWIIKGVQGEIYPCKPDIFAATYEEVEDV